MSVLVFVYRRYPDLRRGHAGAWRPPGAVLVEEPVRPQVGLHILHGTHSTALAEEGRAL